MNNDQDQDDRLRRSPQSNPPGGTDAGGSVTCLVADLVRGDPAAARDLWERFFPRLCGVARKTLAGRPQRVADADDAAQSAFISFWEQARRGDLAHPIDRDSLWSLLGLMTVRKALKQVARERTEKRGGGRVLGETALKASADTENGMRSLENVVGNMASGDFDLHCEELLLLLDEELRIFALLRLMGHTNCEIARELECTERKVERKLNLIRLRWQDELGD